MLFIHRKKETFIATQIPAKKAFQDTKVLPNI